MKPTKRQVLTIVMDGIGIKESHFGNAVSNAAAPNLKWLQRSCPYRTLFAHGTHVGLPSDSDIGNSEVGHNVLGAGRVFDQGAKLVQLAIENSSIYEGSTWKKILRLLQAEKSTLHFIGLLSDGNVHSNDSHLHNMIFRAKKDGVRRVRVHTLFDGRDVGEKSAERYVSKLEQVFADTQGPEFDIAAASGGGRMSITMDRYEADWSMVEVGWNTHVLAEAGLHFGSLSEALSVFRKDPTLTDQYLPPFIISKNGVPNGAIHDGDAVVLFNFRGDRAIEISRAFTESSFPKFNRKRTPKVIFAGMMEYDGDLHIPANYLVSPPMIDNTLSEYVAGLGLRQFACSETQKFGHVTYFWNGNRSGIFAPKLEEYLEIPSDNLAFDLKPWMKAFEITEATIKHMQAGTFDLGRINFANGDMVGMLGRLINAARQTGSILIVTADHGNADEMFDAKEMDYPNWHDLPLNARPTPKTAHTLSPVPFAVFDPLAVNGIKMRSDLASASLANYANTALMLAGLPQREIYLPSLIERT
ncbi:MAG: 2,3-bisphosphoglycerate-independent phosphoglycerate mutase [Proteobacteria bacterium]|nr:2,3-bisphosphoglycerate-independent phosphoglycerate mutase [Pseudomonadota bacterium]